MTNLEMRLNGALTDLSEGEKNAIVRVAALIQEERGIEAVNSNNSENHV